MSGKPMYRRVYSNNNSERVQAPLIGLAAGDKAPGPKAKKRGNTISTGNRISDAAAKRKPFLS